MKQAFLRYLTLFICFFIFCLSHVYSSTDFEKEIDRLSNEIAEKIFNAGKKKVAVVDFTGLDGCVTELCRFTAEEFSIALANESKGFAVLDRGHLRTILQEHKLASTGLIDLKTARRLGKIAGVEALITGTLTPLGKSVRINVKILDTETAVLISASKGNIAMTDSIKSLQEREIQIAGKQETEKTKGSPIRSAELSSEGHSKEMMIHREAQLQAIRDRAKQRSKFPGLDEKSVAVGEIGRLIVHTDVVTKVTFSLDGRRLLSSANMGYVLLWDTQTWDIIGDMFDRNLFSPGSSGYYWLNCSTFSPDGKQYALSLDRKAIISEVENRKIIKRLDGGGNESVSWVTFSSDGQLFVSANLNGIIRMWETQKWQLIREFLGSKAVHNIDISPDGQLLMSCHRGGGWRIRGGAVRVWDVRTGKQIQYFREGEVQANMVCFFPNSRYALFGENDGMVRLWDVKKGKEIKRFEGHKQDVQSVACSPDGLRILTGDSEGIIRLWDVRTGQELEKFRGHTETVRSVTFSPDGRLAVSGGVDKIICIWKLPSKKP